MPDDLKSLFEKKLFSALSTLNAAGTKIRPELYVYAGLPEKNEIGTVRKTVPPQAFLLYIFPETEKINFSSLLDTYRDDIFFIPLPLEPYSACLSSLWLTAGAVRAERFYFSKNAGFPQDIASRLMNTVDDAVINVANEKNCGLLKLRASIQNTIFIAEDSGNSYIKAEKGFPALVCGAGPSLKGQLGLIRKYQDRMVIIAAGRTGTILKNAGIDPDFTVYVDAEGFGEKTDENNSGTVLIALTSSSHKKVSCFEKRIWMEGDSLFFNRYMRRNGMKLENLSFSGTSTVAAIDMAVKKLGCGSLAVTGNDFCLSKEGDFHSPDSASGEKYAGNIFMVPGNDEDTVPTIKELDILRKNLEAYLASSLQGFKIFNCTDGGAHIAGMKKMCLDDFLKENAVNAKVSSLFRKGLQTIPAPDIRSLKKSWNEFLDLFNSWSADYNNSDILLKKEEKLLSGSPLRDFADAISIYSGDIRNCIPDSPSCGKESNMAYSELSFRRLRKWLAEDIMNDLDSLELDPDIGYDSRTFTAFRNYALSFVASGNREFSELLGERTEFETPVISRIFSRSQDYPVIELEEESSTVRLDDAATVIASFIWNFKKTENFDPSRDVVLIPVGGNWNYAVEFARIFPEARMVVIETLPDVFSKVIDIAMFMQYFNPDTVIAAAHPLIPGWKKFLKDSVLKMKKENTGFYCLVPPHTDKIPCLKNISEEIGQILFP